MASEWEWGVNTFTSIMVGKSKVKISLQDIALIMQITSYSNEQMAQETVQKLHEIRERIELSEKNSRASDADKDLGAEE